MRDEFAAAEAAEERDNRLGDEVLLYVVDGAAMSSSSVLTDCFCIPLAFASAAMSELQALHVHPPQQEVRDAVQRPALSPSHVSTSADEREFFCAAMHHFIIHRFYEAFNH